MNENFVTYELAKKLEEKGFNEPCYGYYHRDGGDDSFEMCGNGDREFLNSKNRYRVAAPTIPQVLKWLRQEKEIHIATGYSNVSKWRYIIIHLGDNFVKEANVWGKGFDTNEQAALAGIEYVLDNLI